MPEFDALKDSNSQDTKLFNWNLIITILENYEIFLETDAKNLLVAGDLLEIVELLHIIKQKEEELNKNASLNNFQKEIPPENNELEKGAIDIYSVNIGKEITETENCLEFLLITLSRSLEINPKQAAGLLANSYKYLSHLFVKGAKGDYKQILEWLKDIYTYSQHFAMLIINEKGSGSVEMVLSALKGGLYSKDLSTALWTCKVFAQISDHLNMENIVFSWFVASDGGMDGTLCMYELHKNVEQELAELYISIGKDKLNELLTQHIKNAIQDELKYGLFIQRLVQPLKILCGNQQYLLNTIANFIEIFSGMADNDGRHNPSQRAVALGILCDIWETFPEIIEEKLEIGDYIQNLLKRASRDSNSSLQIFALTLIFNLLETFAPAKKPYAPVLYRVITCSLAENITSVEIRHYIMKNLQTLYIFQPNIPIQILVEPYAKQIQLRENFLFLLNLFDFNFLWVLTNHQKLNSICAFHILDICAKALIKDPLLGLCADSLMLPLMFRARNNSLLFKLLISLTKVR